MSRLIIAGSRNFDNYSHLARVMSKFKTIPDEVVCGEAKGADALGRKWAEEHGVEVASFPADWDRYGKSAGYRRNDVMAEYGTHCLAFWNGQLERSGTRHMMDLATKHGLRLYVVLYPQVGCGEVRQVKNMRHGVKPDPNNIRIDRETIFGNPFYMNSEDERDKCVDDYREYLIGKPELLQQLPLLANRNILCWCAPKACHGDVLKAFVHQINVGLPMF